MEEITLCLSLDTYDRIVDMMHESGFTDISVARFVEIMLINEVYYSENV